MVVKKTQVKPKQAKPKMQKTPNNKTVKAVNEAKTQAGMTKAKTQATKTVAKENTKKETKPKLTKTKTPKVIEPKKDTITVLGIDPKGNPVIDEVNVGDNQPKMDYIKPEVEVVKPATPSHDGEMPKCPEEPVEKVLTHTEIEDVFLDAMNTNRISVNGAKKLYKTLGFDSLEMLDVAFRVENELGIAFTKDDAKDLTRGSFDAGVKLIESYYNIGR